MIYLVYSVIHLRLLHNGMNQVFVVFLWHECVPLKEKRAGFKTVQ